MRQKSDVLYFYAKTKKNLQKTEGMPPDDFFDASLKKNILRLKNKTFWRKKRNFVKQDSLAVRQSVKSYGINT